ncbi:hypothetical protein PGT21_021867 [Puccinia graminis f. sp. tritici]|uniref:Uncharacterized protein n=1 Tax=Puccinia graminis f. sp. tritici TaxID=56615 RepID=A0A5B0M1J7_PUCGR|nr:hypothetical protein PGT21_021867 [Puccinia graminis f. sp. tritici]
MPSDDDLFQAEEQKEEGTSSVLMSLIGAAAAMYLLDLVGVLNDDWIDLSIGSGSVGPADCCSSQLDYLYRSHQSKAEDRPRSPSTFVDK